MADFFFKFRIYFVTWPVSLLPQTAVSCVQPILQNYSQLSKLADKFILYIFSLLSKIKNTYFQWTLTTFLNSVRWHAISFRGYNIYQSAFLLFVILNWWKPSCCVHELKILQENWPLFYKYFCSNFFDRIITDKC